jgi:hypothetical protein
MNSWIITTQEFLLSLIDTGQYIHITDGKKHIRLSNTNGKTDIYFTAWSQARKWSWRNGRVKDVDIVTKKYFFIDYDIRSQVFEETWDLLDTKDLFVYMEQIKEQFTGMYKYRKYIVFSGNWFHVYYYVDNVYYQPVMYQQAVREIYKNAPYTQYIDMSTVNIANLARVPWFLNTKVKIKYWLPEEMCRVVYSQEVWTSFELPNIYENVQKQIAKKKPKLKRNQIKTESDLNSIYMPDLIAYYKGFELAANGREFKWKDGNMWMFYDRDLNLIIYTGTKHLTGTVKGYNPYTFIKYEVLGNNFNHARDVFNELKNAGFLKD